MDSIVRLSGPLLGLWLAIIGIAIAFGIVNIFGDSLRRRRRRHPAHDDGGGQ